MRRFFRASTVGAILVSVLASGAVPVLAAAPAAPSNLAGVIGTNQDAMVVINLTWRDNSNNETGFVIESATNTAFNLDYIEFRVPANTTSFADNTVSGYPDTRFYYRVYAVGTDGRSSYSNVINVLEPPMVIPTPPDAPGNLAAAGITSTSASFSWRDNSNNEKGFILERSTDSGFLGNVVTFSTDASNITTMIDDTLSPSTSYYFRVYAWNVVDVSGFSNVVKVTTHPPSQPPSAPGGLNVGALDSKRVFLSWTDNSNNESGFKIERAKNAEFTQELKTFTVAANIATYLDTTVQVGVTYYYRIKATNSEGDSEPSQAVSIKVTQPAPTLAAPGNLTAAVSGSQVLLRWNDNSTGETGFTIERARSLAFNRDLVTFNTSANVRLYIDSSVEQGGTYYYRVKATGAAVSSVSSNVVRVIIPGAVVTTTPTTPPTDTTTAPDASTATTTIPPPPPPPAAPSALRITLISSSTINMTWVDNSTDEAGYLVQRAEDGAFNLGAIEFRLPANTEIYEDGSVKTGTTYYYRVVARGTPASSTASNIISATVPVALTTIIPTNTSLPTTSTPFQTVPPPSTPVSTTTNQVPSTIPASLPVRTNPPESRQQRAFPESEAPTGLTAQPGMRYVLLSWTDNSNHESGYHIERSMDGENWVRIGSTSISQTSFNDRGRDLKVDWWSRLMALLFGGLQRHTTYFYRVTAYAGGGVSAYCDAVTVATK